MGRGPKQIQAYLFGDCQVVRLHGDLTAVGRQLVKTLLTEKGRELLKPVQTHPVEIASQLLEAMVEEITDVKFLSLHHDISMTTAEFEASFN